MKELKVLRRQTDLSFIEGLGKNKNFSNIKEAQEALVNKLIDSNLRIIRKGLSDYLDRKLVPGDMQKTQIIQEGSVSLEKQVQFIKYDGITIGKVETKFNDGTFSVSFITNG